jgi:hypothetical protein
MQLQQMQLRHTIQLMQLQQMQLRHTMNATVTNAGAT